MQRLSDQAKLPTPLMLTALSVLKSFPSSSAIVISILNKLVGKRVWKNAHLWKGFILCLRETAPKSFHVLITLPVAQIEDVLSKAAGVRIALKQYLENLSVAQRNSALIQNIMAILE